MADSDEEFWTTESASQAYHVPRPPPSEPLGSESESNNDRSPTRSRLKTPKRTSERGVGTTAMTVRRPPLRSYVPPTRHSAATPFSPRQFSRTISSSSSGNDSEPMAVSADSDTDHELAHVEAMIDTESDGSEPPSRGVSFAFSNIESRNGSTTSVSSTASFDSRTGRKRTLDYQDTWSTPLADVPNARKSPRIGQKNAASARSRTTMPQTPSRSARPRPPTIDSPSVSQRKPETPTVSRVCDRFTSAVVLRTPTSSARSDEQRGAMEYLLPSGGAHEIIAHSKAVQKLFDDMNIRWTVQYEIARGESLRWWNWEEVTLAKLKTLQDSGITAPARVSQVICGRRRGTVTPMDLAIWTELDREEAAIREGRFRGLGLQGEWENAANWYGGKVQQVARLEQAAGGEFRLVLVKMAMHKSHRFARFLGSRRLLQVSVPDTLMYTHGAALRDFFKKRFILCGRVFVVLGAKDNKAFLMETREQYERLHDVPGDEQRISLEDFVNWHNPLHLQDNANQPVKKYVTRFDLGFSISVPVLQFDPIDIHRIDDMYVPGYNPQETGKKAPAECIYTDGCGYMNGAALCAIAKRMGLEERPTAVQGRIGGAKGLWVLHLRDQSPTGTPKIWIRASQVKIQLDPNNLNPAHRIFDQLAPPRVSVPSRLSRLTILNLSHNGVPVDVFVELMRNTLDAQVQQLTTWSGPKAMLLLWKAIEKAGGVALKRFMQHAQGTTRAMGLTGRIREDDLEQSDNLVDPKLIEDLQGLDESEMPSVSSLRDPSTGEPLSIHAVAMDLLQAGFHPMQLQLLYDKLKKILTDEIEGTIRDFHISVPLSAEAFIVPDPYSVLKEGEIHFKSTKELKDPVEHSQPHIILGDVLIYRNPCRLPSDVRKVMAVECPKLAEYTNVIVLPTVGPCSYASILAGGDYDGDTCVCVYDPRIVAPFRNSSIITAPDNFLKDNFEDQGMIQQVSALATEMSQADDPDKRRQKLQEALLCGLTTAPIGQYSSFHENAIYMNGYDHPDTIRIALMFNTILDSRKTGHVVQEDVRKRDKRHYDKEQPQCLKSTKSAAEPWQDNFMPLRRGAALGRFVLDVLLDEGKRMRDEKLKQYDQLATFEYQKDKDADLVAPFNAARPFMSHDAFKDDLARIKEHIDEHITRWRTVASESFKEPKTPSTRGKAAARAGRSGKSKRAAWDELGRSFAAGPKLSKDSPLVAFSTDLEQLKASLAYEQNPKFAWKVAFQALCRIKAKTRNPVALTGEFADMMTIPSTAGRVLEQSRQASV